MVLINVALASDTDTGIKRIEDLVGVRSRSTTADELIAAIDSHYMFVLPVVVENRRGIQTRQQ